VFRGQSSLYRRDHSLLLFQRQAVGVHDFPEQRRRNRRALLRLVIKDDAVELFYRAY
jgi:hypothetical protein